jgi:hypothetical protein
MIEPFDDSEYAEIDEELKNEFTDYMYKYRELSADIITAECDIESDENDIKKLETLSSIKNNKLHSDIEKMKLEFFNETNIEQKRNELDRMCSRKRKMIDNIKSLLDTEGSHSLLCPVCLEKNVNCFLKTCGHTFCLKCLNTLRQQKCPMCRNEFDNYEIKNLIFS